MPLNKQPVNINFAKGLETKTDSKQIPMDNFLALNNAVFTKTGALTKRNGFNNLTNLPVTTQTTLTTLNSNLLATGSDLYAYSSDTNQWYNKGLTQPVQLSVKSIVRASTSQSSPDSAVASNNLVATAYVDNGVAYYQVSDSTTGTQIIPRTALESTATNPRVFILGNFFIITYIATVGGTTSLKYLSIVAATLSVNPPVTVNNTVQSLTTGYDGTVANNNLYLAWGESASSIGVSYVTSGLITGSTQTISTTANSLISVTADTVNSMIYVTYSGGTTTYANSFNYLLVPIMAQTTCLTGVTLSELTSIVNTGVLNVIYEVPFTYSYNGNRTDYVNTLKVTPTTTSTPGTVSSPTQVLRSVGLASKPIIVYNYYLKSNTRVTITVNSLPTTSTLNPNLYTIVNSTVYFLVAYGNATDNQPSYFLTDLNGNIIMRLAYSNGGGYAASQVLPTISANSGVYSVPYLIKDLLATVNKTVDPGLPVNAIYTQTGINLATFTINDNSQYSSEIANALYLTGGQLWEYDGVRPVEQGFQVWPEDISLTTSTPGTSATYNYVFTYEWTDNAGNLHRSAPSIPVTIKTAAGAINNTIYVPTLRLTYKSPPNPVRIVGYRWSVAQQVFYQFTSITNPVLNTSGTTATWVDSVGNTDSSTTGIDFVTITDTLPDSSILGNVILYTTGGVIENIAAPASIASALFDNRLWLVDAEDQNLLWYSKQVIEAVPVEMSDLLTIYVAPTSGAQGSTGPVAALSAMDDKLVIFKKDAIYYINGVGPDNTGANGTYSDPVFVTATVGTINPNSIVLMPNGLMFQSDKGIWLLGRDLVTNYIGAPVEQYNSYTVLSARAIPATNQVRFILNNNVTLMYDYFVNQWGTHSNVGAISSTIYGSAHTYLNSNGQVFQETAGLYVDGSSPVLISLTTAWINLAGLQGFERFYFGYLLGTYFSPFTLDINIAYDYNTGSQQNIKVTPGNYAPNWGNEALWGSGGPWGGNVETNVFEARFFPMKQKCQSFQVSITEVYDATLGVAPGQGLSLSGMNLVVGMKRGYRTQSSGRSFGTN